MLRPSSYAGAGRRAFVRATALILLTAGAVGLAQALRGSAEPQTAPLPLSLKREEAAPARAAGFSFPSPTFVVPYANNRATQGAITFGQPTIAGFQGNGFEPDLRIDFSSNPDRIYMSVPGALSSDTSWVWHSRDAGRTFKFVPGSIPKEGKPVACAGGGDTELAVDAVGRVYFADLTLANFSTARSDDGGRVWVCSNTGVPATVVDRQWYAVDGDPTALAPSGPTANSVYLATNRFLQGQVNCSGVITPGNNELVMFRSLPGPLGGIQFGPFKSISAPCDEAIMGNVEVSPVATTTGEVGQPPLAIAKKHAYVIHDNDPLNKILVARCFWVDFGAPVANTSDPSGVRCNEFTVASFPGQKTGANFPSLAIDKAGNLYAIWQQAPLSGAQAGNTSLYYSYSTDEGVTWSAATQIPTPGLLNNVMTWAAAGDDGRVGFAWYGTAAAVGTTGTCTANLGPDSVKGPWSVYYMQTLNGHDPNGVTWSAPVLASQYPVHRNGMFTLIGQQCGDRAVGDFMYMQIGAQGEAHIAYGYSAERGGPHTMYVRQNGGPGLFAGPDVTGDPILFNSATDPAGDGKYELNAVDDANKPNLDILSSSFTKPDPAECVPTAIPCYRVQMTLNNLSLTPPGPDTVIDWSTQWFVPSDPSCSNANAVCSRGGSAFHTYAESVGGGAPQCYVGETAVQLVGGGITLTYPGTPTALPATACQVQTGPNGTITIFVPVTSVSLPVGVAQFGNARFSVSATTMTLNAPANSVQPVGSIGGVLFDLVDVVRAYTAIDTPTAVALRSFAASVSRNGAVALRWRTGSEVGVAGFNVYRDRAGKRVRLNRSVIVASARGGGTYVFRDRMPRGAQSARYFLQAVALDGRRSWLGSTTVKR